MGTQTRYYSSTNAGAGIPTLANNFSDLINLLDKLLFGTDIGLVTLTSATSSGTTATVTVSGGHGFLNKQVVSVAGANESQYNGTFRITYISGTQFSYTMSGAASSPATGTLTASLPAVGGWAKAYSGTGKAIYKSNDVSASGRFFRVDDTGTTSARVVGYETASDVDTGTNPFPTTAQLSGGGYFLKSNSATQRAWWLVADPKCVWLSTSYDGTGWHTYGFGDYKSFYAGDVYNAFLACAPGGALANSPNLAAMSAGASDTLYSARAGSMAVGSVRTPKLGIGGFSGHGTTAAQPNFSYPMPSGADVLVSQAPIMICEYQAEARGLLYGMRQILNKYGPSATAGEVRVGVPGFSDGLLLLRETSPNAACVGFDLGDWS